ncbi:MAG: hypothetical protein QME70_01980 [Bacillota bacterium]|nr:hypothetical protein [Bacillota bacterium]
MRRDGVTLFLGPYGSGKTEISVNYSVRLARATGGTHQEVGGQGGIWLADLDLVTPYFRAREVREELEREGVRVVAPDPAWGEGDLPVLPPGLSGLLRGGGPGVVDVGGGDTGARVLGSLRPLLADSCHIWVVLNPYRPGCGSPAGMAALAREVTGSSRLQPTGVVSNPHLGGETTPPVVERGHRLVEQAASLLGLPVVMLAALQDIAHRVEKMVAREVFPLRRYLLLPWE